MMVIYLPSTCFPFQVCIYIQRYSMYLASSSFSTTLQCWYFTILSSHFQILLERRYPFLYFDWHVCLNESSTYTNNSQVFISRSYFFSELQFLSVFCESLHECPTNLLKNQEHRLMLSPQIANFPLSSISYFGIPNYHTSTPVTSLNINIHFFSDQ